jgi:hypothetical protein
LPPWIGGAPPRTVAAGDRYTFTPQASDPDGDALTFSITSRPAWLTFKRSNGALTGAPTAADVGTYRGISIRVSDGKNERTLPPFDIDVVAVGSRTATIQWLAPTQNEDGSPLTDLAGFEIRYGLQTNAYSNSIDVPSPGIATYVVTGLVPGTYYFTMVAYNAMKVRSILSNEMAIVVR